MVVWSVVKKSELYGAFRLDAECYRPSVLQDERALHSCKTVSLGDIAMITDGQHGYHEVDPNSPIRHITAKCVKQGTVDGDGVDRLAFSTHNTNRRSQLEVDDVLLSTAGTIGLAGLVSDDILPANIDQDVARITLRQDSPVDPAFLVAFLNSELGRFQSERATTGQIQCHISLSALRGFEVPVVNWQGQPATALRQAVEKRRHATTCLTEAITLLESALGLDKLDLTPRLFYERPYADVQAASRFDAEYYQPPKKAVLDDLGKMPGQAVRDQYRSIRQLWQPDKADDAEQVRNYDLTDALQPFLDDTVMPATCETIASTKKKLKPGDLVVSRLRSYLKEIAVVLDTGPIPMVGSTEFIVLRPKKGAIRVEALLVYLRSKYVQTVLKWCQDGSNHPRFHEGELLNLPIPDVVRDHQDEIAAKVQASNQARRETRRLLDEAKTMIELAILEDE